MNTKRWFLASFVAFILLAGLDYIFNAHCLKTLYATTAHLWRPIPEMAKLLPLGNLIYLVVAFLFTYIYVRGYQGKPSGLGEGLRYGLVIGLFASIPMAGWSYITMPIPYRLAVYWFLMGLIEFLVMGMAVGLIYKENK